MNRKTVDQHKLIYKQIIFLLFAFALANTAYAQQRPPFSEKTVKMEDGALLLPYTKGEVKKNITGAYKEISDKICSIITAWDSVNPPQGFEVDCFGYEKGLEIYFRNYISENGIRFTEEGGPHLNIYINDPMAIVGSPVAPGIYLCPQKTAEFFGYPVYNKGCEMTVVTKLKIQLYVPVSQEEYMEAIIAQAEKDAKKYPRPDQQDYRKELQEMEKNYQELYKVDKDAAKAVKQAIDELKEETNQKEDNGQSFVDPVSMLKNKLSAMTEEEKKRDAYHGGEDFSGLMPYEQREYGDALVRINPLLLQETGKSGVHLLVLNWRISSDNSADEDKPRLYNKGQGGYYHTDYLMNKLYQNSQIWNAVFSICI